MMNTAMNNEAASMNAPRPLLMIEQVKRVYSGKANKCCCGCAGTYYEAADAAPAKMVKKVVGLINAADELLDDEAGHKAIEIGDRVYIAYLAD